MTQIVNRNANNTLDLNDQDIIIALPANVQGELQRYMARVQNSQLELMRSGLVYRHKIGSDLIEGREVIEKALRAKYLEKHDEQPDTNTLTYEVERAFNAWIRYAFTFTQEHATAMMTLARTLSREDAESTSMKFTAFAMLAPNPKALQRALDLEKFGDKITVARAQEIIKGEPDNVPLVFDNAPITNELSTPSREAVNLIINNPHLAKDILDAARKTITQHAPEPTTQTAPDAQTPPTKPEREPKTKPQPEPRNLAAILEHIGFGKATTWTDLISTLNTLAELGQAHVNVMPHAIEHGLIDAETRAITKKGMAFMEWVNQLNPLTRPLTEHFTKLAQVMDAPL